ncbi:MAG TPA: S1/P1 nuclease [Sediminibacterium sp.]|nr:S1/P1 nuclease [Sediminibacterium sp.]
MILLLIASAGVKTVKAYDKTGHLIVAQVANKNLSKKARKALEKLLGENGIVYYANWADEIKSDHAYDWASKLHYYNFDKEYTASDMDQAFEKAAATPASLIHAIDSLVRVLKSNHNDTEAVKFLVHFVGDLSQPLHLGHTKDRGGNAIRVRWFRDSTNLHTLWDNYMVEFEKLSYTEYADYLMQSDRLTKPAYSDRTVKKLFTDSYLISQKIYAYSYNRMNEYSYFFNFGNSLKQSMLNGGYLLARLLNEIYG